MSTIDTISWSMYFIVKRKQNNRLLNQLFNNNYPIELSYFRKVVWKWIRYLDWNIDCPEHKDFVSKQEWNLCSFYIL